MQWLQSPRQATIFDVLFVRCNPGFVAQLSPLVTLSISAAVTSTLDTNLKERLIWLEIVFSAVDIRVCDPAAKTATTFAQDADSLQDPDLIDVAPRIMDVLSQRLQSAYMAVSEEDSNNPILRKISVLARRANELKAMTIGAA